MKTAIASNKNDSTTNGRLRTNYQSMTDAQLWANVYDKLTASAMSLAEAATCVGILKARGIDLSRLDGKLLSILMKIDEGTLLPEAVIRFSSMPMVLTAVSTLSIETQAELIARPTVKVLRVNTITGDSVVDVPISQLGKHELPQVFAQGKIRTIKQQAKSLKSDTPKAEQTMVSISIPVSAAEYKRIEAVAYQDSIAMCEVFRRAARKLGWL